MHADNVSLSLTALCHVYYNTEAPEQCAGQYRHVSWPQQIKVVQDQEIEGHTLIMLAVVSLVRAITVRGDDAHSAGARVSDKDRAVPEASDAFNRC